MNDLKNCPVCGLDNVTIQLRGSGALSNGNSSYGQIDSVNCKRCGEFCIYRSDVSHYEAENILPNYCLSARIRELNDQDDQNIKDIPLGKKEIDRIIKLLPTYNPLEKQHKLLYNIMRKSEFPGDKVSLVPIHDLPLAWAVSIEEFTFYINSLEGRKLITKEFFRGNFDVTILADGWEYLVKCSTNFEEKTQAFVAMSFSDDMGPFWENPIKQAIKDAGYTPYRIGVEPHSDKIDVKIMSEIKNSRFIVADVTEQKHGVYFEAGFALGLGLPVIWCVKKEDLKNVHFDTRQYNHIVWETEKELKYQLYNFICAIIGKRRVAAI